jgi:hypothetical protein
MPDFGSPVAQNVSVGPQQSLQTLSGLMSVKQQQLGLQQQQLGLQRSAADIQTAQAGAQAAQQQMQERLLLQSSMKSGKDPEGNSLMNPDGTVDSVALTSFANKYLPATGQGVVQNIVKTQADRIGLNEAVRGLDQNYRNDLSGIVNSQINGDPTKVGPAIDAYVAQQGPNAPAALAQAAARAKSLVGNLGDHAEQATNNAGLTHLSQELQPAATTAAQQAPATTTMIGPRGGLQVVQTNPRSAIPMGAVGPETPPQGIPLQIMMDSAGNPHFIGSALQGPGQGPAPWTTQPQAQAQKAAADDMTNHFTGLNASAQSLPLVTGLTKTIESLAPSAFTGPGGDKRQYMAGLARVFGVNLTGDAQTDTNLMNKAMAQLNISSPAGTDAARALIEAGQPNSHMDATAIKEAAGTVASQVRMNAAERTFLQTTRFSNRGAGDPEAYQQGRQQFEMNADPRIWQYEEMVRSKNPNADAFLNRQPDKNDLVRKEAALERMGFFAPRRAQVTQ